MNIYHSSIIINPILPTAPAVCSTSFISIQNDLLFYRPVGGARVCAYTCVFAFFFVLIDEAWVRDRNEMPTYSNSKKIK